MKRYRITSMDFDSRAHGLEPAQDQWEQKTKDLHERNRQQALAHFKLEFGEHNLDVKVQNFIDLKFKPFSVMAFHNKFLHQTRNAFVAGSYYPSLTAACSLGERILNHLILTFRDYFVDTPEYKKVYRKSSFDNWTLAIEILVSWKILLPSPAAQFHSLNEKRNRALHFNPETDHNDRELALSAIHLLQEIISGQFSAFGSQPWMFIVPGESYIKKDWEENPFVKHVYLPNCVLVGPNHKVESVIPKFVINDRDEYEDRIITDEEFIDLRTKGKADNF